MRFCLNQVKKCCGCLDIRTGAYLIAFLSLIRVFVYLLFIPEAFFGYDFRNYILPIIGGTLLLITIDIILVVGLVKNRIKYLNIWLFIEGFIILVRIKGQLILKCLFRCLQILPKNKGKQLDLKYHSSEVEFFCSFFGRIKDTKKSF